MTRGYARTFGIRVPEGSSLWTIITPLQECGALSSIIAKNVAQVSHETSHAYFYSTPVPGPFT